jgi:thiamine pyrophosphate-dependent acetolactate synthase large subunit-like protein
VLKVLYVDIKRIANYHSTKYPDRHLWSVPLISAVQSSKIKNDVVIIDNSVLDNVYSRAQKAGKEAAELSAIKPSHNWADFAESLGAEGRVVEKPE